MGHEGTALGALHVLPLYQRSDDGVFRVHHAALGETLDHGVGGGFFPAQLLGAETDQLTALYRLMGPEYLAEAQLAVKNFRCLHRDFILGRM